MQISKAIGSAMPNASLVCYAGGILAGWKFYLAFGCKVGSVATKIAGIQDISERLNKASDHYWTKAKKDSFRDLTAMAVLITWGLVASHAGEALMKEEEKPTPNPDQDKEPETPLINIGPDSYLYYPKYALDTFLHYPKTTLTTAGILSAVVFRKVYLNDLIAIRLGIRNKYQASQSSFLQRNFIAPGYKGIGKVFTCCINCIQQEIPPFDWNPRAEIHDMFV